MPDIFLSYSREDQASARRFADSLQREGFSVWWDQSLRSGESYDEVTEQALKSARTVVVLWSGKSVASRWVRAEATIADRAGTLVPVMIEPCDRPVMFELRQCADLAGWQGATTDPRWIAFVGDLRFRLQGPAVVAPPEAAATAEIPPRGARPGSRRVVLAVLVLLALALFGAGLRVITARPERSLQQAATLAVLPFANLSSDTEQEFFADGLTEELLNSLSRVDGLRVTGRTSAFYFKGRNEDLRAIGEKLGVDNLLEGSVRRDGDRIRINAQLVKAGDGFHLWSQTYDRPAQDLFAVQEDIARSVAQAMQITLGVGELGALPGMTRDALAYEAYLEGKAQQRQSWEPSMREALEQFELAVKRDPQFLLAWLEVSSVYREIALGEVSPSRSQELRAQADAALAMARELSTDERLVQALDLGRGLPRGDWSEVERGRPILEAVATDFRHASVIRTADTLDLQSLAVDKARRAIPGLERDRTLDPLSARVVTNLAGAYAFSGRLVDSLAEFQRGLELSLGTESLMFLTMARESGDEKSLESAWERLVALDGSPMVIELHALRHRPVEARKALRTWASNSGSSITTELALWASYFDDPELALKVMQADGDPEHRLVIALTSWWPSMAGMRKLAGFKDLVRELGLVDYWREFGWGEHCQPVGTDDFECH